jgi:hypothetical protein
METLLLDARSGLAAVEVNVRERRYGVFVNRDVKQINIGV